MYLEVGWEASLEDSLRTPVWNNFNTSIPVRNPRIRRWSAKQPQKLCLCEALHTLSHREAEQHRQLRSPSPLTQTLALVFASEPTHTALGTGWFTTAGHLKLLLGSDMAFQWILEQEKMTWQQASFRMRRWWKYSAWEIHNNSHNWFVCHRIKYLPIRLQKFCAKNKFKTILGNKTS